MSQVTKEHSQKGTLRLAVSEDFTELDLELTTHEPMTWAFIADRLRDAAGMAELNAKREHDVKSH